MTIFVYYLCLLFWVTILDHYFGYYLAARGPCTISRTTSPTIFFSKEENRRRFRTQFRQGLPAARGVGRGRGPERPNGLPGLIRDWGGDWGGGWGCEQWEKTCVAA